MALALRLLARLGRGAYGEVWHAEDASGRPYAVKILDSQHNRFSMERVQRERDLLVRLKSPHLPQLYAAFAREDFFFLVQELLPGGSVAQLQDTWRAAHPDSPPGLPESLVQVIFAQAVAAVAAIHAAGAAHRDIKPDNLLIDKDGRVRLIDLGLAAQAEPGGASPSIPLALSSSSPSSGSHLLGHGFHASPPSAALQRSSTTGPIAFSTPSFGFGSSPPPYSGSFLSYPTLSSSPVSFSALSADFDDLRCSAVGSPLYRAPETFAEGARRAAYSARKADLWSLGVLLHELLTGSYCLAPDPDDLPALRSHLRDYASGRSPLYWPAECVTSPMAQDLVAQLLNPRPALRPSLASIQAHPFLASIDVNSPLPWLPPPPPSPEAGRPPIERVIASRLWVGREAGFAYGPPVTLVRT